MAALHALLALPGLTLAVASALLLYECQRPLLPVCTNALLECRAGGWVPPHASAAAAFLHLNARLPTDAALLRAVQLPRQQNAYRLTRQAVVGGGGEGGGGGGAGVGGGAGGAGRAASAKAKPSAADIAHRERRAAMVMALPVRLMSREEATAAVDAGGETDEEEGEDEEATAAAEEEQQQQESRRRVEMTGRDGKPMDDPEARPTAVCFAVDPTFDAPTPVGLLQPLEWLVREALDYHQLYPSTGCTPLLLALRPQDAPSAAAAAAALAAGALPFQQAEGEGAGVRYILDVPWSATECSPPPFWSAGSRRGWARAREPPGDGQSSRSLGGSRREGGEKR